MTPESIEGQRTTERPRTRLISTKKLLDRRAEIASSVEESARAANDLLQVFGDEIALPRISPQTVVQFSEFLNKHIFEAMGVSTAAHLMATAKDAKSRGRIRRCLMDMLQGESQPSLGSLVPWRPERKLSEVAILQQDEHLKQHYLPVLVELDGLGNQTEEQLSQAELARKQSLTHQGKITASFLQGATRARATHSLAQEKREALDRLSGELTKKILGRVDIVRDTGIDGIIKQADHASRVESNARINEARARNQAAIALMSFLPAVGSTEAITTGQIALSLIEEMANTAFLFSIACYESDIALAMQIASAQSVDAFKRFMEQAAARRKQLYDRVQQMKEVIKVIPSETGRT